MPKVMITGDVNNVDMYSSKATRGDFFVAKFRLEYDVEAVSSSDGEFTYETKVDEYDREYMKRSKETKMVIKEAIENNIKKRKLNDKEKLAINKYREKWMP